MATDWPTRKYLKYEVINADKFVFLNALHGLAPNRGAGYLFAESDGTDFNFLFSCGVVRCGAVRFGNVRKTPHRTVPGVTHHILKTPTPSIELSCCEDARYGYKRNTFDWPHHF